MYFKGVKLSSFCLIKQFIMLCFDNEILYELMIALMASIKANICKHEWDFHENNFADANSVNSVYCLIKRSFINKFKVDNFQTVGINA